MVGSCKLPNRQTIEDFESDLVSLPLGERVAVVTTIAESVAQERGWPQAKNIEKLNKGRTVYFDENSYYSLDTQHGRFEQLNTKGKHLGEVNMTLGKIKGSLDKSGSHNLRVK